MPSLKLSVVIVSLALMGANPIAADEMTIVRSAEPVVYSHAERATDVLGIRPGMTAVQVREILGREYADGEVVEQETGLAVTNNSIQMSSQPYLANITVTKGEDKIRVVFGTPSTDSTVVAVTRTLNFRDPLNAPRVDATHMQLIAKYGQQSQSVVKSSATLTLLNWLYNANDQVRCANDNCPVAYNDFQPSGMKNYQRSVAAGQHLLIRASVFSHHQDRSRVGMLEVTLDANQARLEV